MRKAIQAYKDRGEPNLRAAGETYDIKCQTVGDRINGAQSRRMAHSDQQIVAPEEEEAI
ncbi:hypothetical protein Q9L58_010287, partial [Maublancomyces gigas]